MVFFVKLVIRRCDGFFLNICRCVRKHWVRAAGVCVSPSPPSQCALECTSLLLGLMASLFVHARWLSGCIIQLTTTGGGWVPPPPLDSPPSLDQIS